MFQLPEPEQKVGAQLAARVDEAAINSTRPGLKSLSSDTISLEASMAQGLLVGLPTEVRRSYKEETRAARYIELIYIIYIIYNMYSIYILYILCICSRKYLHKIHFFKK